MDIVLKIWVDIILKFGWILLKCGWILLKCGWILFKNVDVHSLKCG